MKDQSPLGMSYLKTKEEDIFVTDKDKKVLQRLSSKLAEFAARPIEKQKAELWTAHNDLETKQPLVFCDPENGWNEIITEKDIECENELAQDWEMILRREICYATEMLDDKVVTATFDLPYIFEETDWGLHEKRLGGEHSGEAYSWDAPLKSFEEDLSKIHTPKITINYNATNKMLDIARDTMGEFLDVKIRHKWWWTLGMTMTYVYLRGLEQMMMDLYDYPEGFHGLMQKLCDGTLEKLDFLQEHNLLCTNTGNTYVGSGGFGWTKQLPQKDFNPEKVRTIDMWGFAESQETVSINPTMFAEFVFPYQQKILKRFGLACYGCCEPLDKRWEYVSTIPNLRRVSCSAWADHPVLGEMLSNKYIFSFKPNPSHLAVPQMNEDVVREEIRKVIDVARQNGNVLEIIMKDNNTLGQNRNNAFRWVEIAKEEVAKL